MSNLPKITIVTPSFNQGEYIEKTITSVLAQDYPALEFFVFDGGSTDNTVEILGKYDAEITFWESTPDRGQSHAINKGFARATGEIFTWLCSDDYLLPGALHLVGKYFQEGGKELALIHGQCEILKPNEPSFFSGGNYSGNFIDYFTSPAFPQPAAFFRRDVVPEGKPLLDERLHYAMDYDLWVRIALQGREILPVEDRLAAYLFHDASKSVKDSLKFLEDFNCVVSRILRTVQAEKEIELLKRIGVFQENTEPYSVINKAWSISQIQEFFITLLRMRTHRLASLGAFAEAEALLATLATYPGGKEVAQALRPEVEFLKMKALSPTERFKQKLSRFFGR